MRFLLLLLASLAAGLPLRAADSLVSNGPFESATRAPDWPDDWGRPKAGAQWMAEDGNHFVRLVSSQPGEMVMLYREVKVPAGVPLWQLRWRWRVSNVQVGEKPWFDARIMMEWRDPSGGKVNPAPSAPSLHKDTKGWVEGSQLLRVPEGASILALMPTLFQVKSGTLDLDDVSLVPADPVALETAAVASLKAAEPLAEAPQPSKWPSPLHVAGRDVLDAQGHTVWLQGVNIVSLEFNPKGEHLFQAARTAIEDWKCNIIRLPVKDDYWYGRDGRQKDGGAAYRALVDAMITFIANRGAYVLLDLHKFRAPLPEHVTFWKDAGARYATQPAVLFDLFNEPHGISWEVWQKGGFVPDDKKPADEDAFAPGTKKGVESSGMQALVDAVRAGGAKNVVVAGGLDWAYDLSGVAQGYALQDPQGRGIIYSTHIYPWKRDWAGKVLGTAEKYPVFVGEVGADIKKMTFIPAAAQEDPATWVPDMLGFIQKYHLHWTGFSFHPGATPVMISDWKFTPTPFWGEPAKRALAGEHFDLKRMR